MINEEKVILMTKLASYEQGEGKKYVPIINYFRTDYISSQLLKSFIAGTAAFLAIMGIYLFYNFEMLIEDVYNIDFVEFGKKIGSIYLMLMAVYLVATYVLALIRYNRAKKSLKNYSANLKRLEKY